MYFSKNDNVSPMVMVDPDIHNLFMVDTAMRFLVVVGTGEDWLVQLFSSL